MLAVVLASVVYRFASVDATADVFATWLRAPGGYRVHPSCVIEVPEGETFGKTWEPSTPCQHRLHSEKPHIQIYASDVHEEASENITGFSSFTADFTVPPMPEQQLGQVVYFWPGFKSQKPEMGYPVIQPVLQYGEHGREWQLQSWFVDANSMRYPVVTAKAIKVHSGDHLTTSMELEGDEWTISGIDKTTGESSVLKIAKHKAGNCDYNYAMLVNENINVDEHCGRMPATSGGITFTNVTLDHHHAWTTRADCANNKRCDCGNAATVDNATGDVTLHWHLD